MNNIWIKNIELKNFQKHADLTISLVNGVNVIHGDSYTGKSCAVRPIKWVFFNEPKGDVVRKEEGDKFTKKTSVKITFENNGKEIIVERVKSNSINSYIVYKGDKKDKVYDSVGKTIPEDVKKLLGVSTLDIDKESLILNVANQITLPFLFDKSGTFRMKLFNKLTGASIIDKVFQSLNKDIFGLNRKEKSEKEHLTETKTNLEKTKVEVEEKQKFHGKFSGKYNQLKKTLEKYKTLKTYMLELKNIDSGLLDTEEKLKNIKSIDEEKLAILRYSAEQLEKLQTFSDEYEQLDKNLKTVNNDLNNIKIANIDTVDLKVKAEKIERLRKIKIELETAEKGIANTENKITTCSDKIETDKQLYKELLKKCGTCPTCNKKI